MLIDILTNLGRCLPVSGITPGMLRSGFHTQTRQLDIDKQTNTQMTVVNMIGFHCSFGYQTQFLN